MKPAYSVSVQTAQDCRHLRSHGDGFFDHFVAARMFCPRQNTQPRLSQVGNIDFGQLGFDGNFQRQVCPCEIPARTRECIQLLCRQLHLFISQQAAHQLGTRVGLAFLDFLGARQQQAGFDFNQHSRHKQVFRRQIKLICFHLGNIVQILFGNLHHRNIENIDILFADQIQQ